MKATDATHQVPTPKKARDNVAKSPDAPSPPPNVGVGSVGDVRRSTPAAERLTLGSDHAQPVSPKSRSALPSHSLSETAATDRPEEMGGDTGSLDSGGRRISAPIEFARPGESRRSIPVDRPGRNPGASYTMNERLADDDNTSADTGSIHLSASFASTSSTSGERAIFTMDLESVPSSQSTTLFASKTSAEVAYEYARQKNKGRISLDRSFPSTSPLKSTFFTTPSLLLKKKKLKRPKLKLSSSAPSRVERGKHERGPHLWSKCKPTGPEDFDLSKAVKNDVMGGGRYDFLPQDG